MNERLPLLLETTELHKHLDDPKLLIVDLSRDSVYQQAHIPGAVFVDFKRLLSGQQPATGKMPAKEQLESLFSEIGLKPDVHVVAYDDEGGGWAGRFLWTLDCIGHEHYSYLNGGIHAWIADQLPLEQTPNKASPSSTKITLNDKFRVDKEFILQHLDTQDICIWDARSKEEYDGTKAFSAKGGHIPGAKNYEWTRAMDKDNALRLRKLQEIEQELSSSGIDKERTIVTHCQTHHRSGFTYLLGKILGFRDIRAYDGSWSEWGNDPDTPVESN